MVMQKPELLLPAGNVECLRAAVANGADAVYLGLNRFNARISAENFNEKNLFSAIEFCHKHNVKAYAALNTLVKNNELKEYFSLMDLAYQAKADAVIIQDSCFIPIIQKNFPGLKIHLSTQATVTNKYSVPKGVDRVVLARELSYDEVKEMSKELNTEAFVHGALCFSYSGQCIFSSMVGGRSGNRGCCAQPCRRRYNNKYALSTMDLCLLEKIPFLIEAGVASFKIEGRLRSPLYTATAARIYRKYIDGYFEKKKIDVEEKDIDDLKIAFNREFTQGFMFNNSIVDSKAPMNRGLFIGIIKQKKLLLKKKLKLGDGISLWEKDHISGFTVKRIKKEGDYVNEASIGDIVELDLPKSVEYAQVYKTSSVDLNINLGDGLKFVRFNWNKRDISIPHFPGSPNLDSPKLFVKAYNKKSAIAADKAKADVIYYDLLNSDCEEVKQLVKHAKFFVFTPRILSSAQAEECAKKIKEINPEGVLIANAGVISFLKGLFELHFDYSLNCFNDVNISCFKGMPIISPELNFDEIIGLKNKGVIAFIHGDIVLMTTKEPLKAPELVDDDGRHFRVRKRHHLFEILNESQLGLFTKVKDYNGKGIKYFYIDLEKDVGKFVRIYHSILKGKDFDDKKIKKGYTLGHFQRGVE